MHTSIIESLSILAAFLAATIFMGYGFALIIGGPALGSRYGKWVLRIGTKILRKGIDLARKLAARSLRFLADIIHKPSPAPRRRRP